MASSSPASRCKYKLCLGRPAASAVEQDSLCPGASPGPAAAPPRFLVLLRVPSLEVGHERGMIQHEAAPVPSCPPRERPRRSARASPGAAASAANAAPSPAGARGVPPRRRPAAGEGLREPPRAAPPPGLLLRRLQQARSSAQDTHVRHGVSTAHGGLLKLCASAWAASMPHRPLVGRGGLPATVPASPAAPSPLSSARLRKTDAQVSALPGEAGTQGGSAEAGSRASLA